MQSYIFAKMNWNITLEMEDKIFNINDENGFIDVALEVFRLQSVNCDVYAEFIRLLKIDPNKVRRIEDIPFLPIEFFKSHQIIANNTQQEIIFESSGTTGTVASKHFVAKVDLYRKSFNKAFQLFYGKPADYTILALLPSYIERGNSSLVFMVDDLIRQSESDDSGFYLDNLGELTDKLLDLSSLNKKILLIGVTYSLLDLAELNELDIPNAIIMETGGMKGKREELVRTELHEILCSRFHVKSIHSEYSMTELMSQAYSKGDGIFNTPPWMKILIRNVNDPYEIIANNKTGGINIIDLANLYSCSFIATQDLGKMTDRGFEVLGRFDSSDLRGCNLLVG
ncbi:MAG: acyl transferase [Bacteroidota bacterium]